MWNSNQSFTWSCHLLLRTSIWTVILLLQRLRWIASMIILHIMINCLMPRTLICTMRYIWDTWGLAGRPAWTFSRAQYGLKWRRPHVTKLMLPSMVTMLFKKHSVSVLLGKERVHNANMLPVCCILLFKSRARRLF